MPDNFVRLQYSRDGGRNWSNYKERSLGEVGEYRKRVQFHRLGQHRQAVIRFRVSSPIKATCLGAVAQITPASS